MQAGGGLLASMPAELAEVCIAALHTAGYGRAAVIGTVCALNTAPGSASLGCTWSGSEENGKQPQQH